MIDCKSIVFQQLELNSNVIVLRVLYHGDLLQRFEPDMKRLIATINSFAEVSHGWISTRKIDAGRCCTAFSIPKKSALYEEPFRDAWLLCRTFAIMAVLGWFKPNTFCLRMKCFIERINSFIVDTLTFIRTSNIVIQGSCSCNSPTT